MTAVRDLVDSLERGRGARNHLVMGPVILARAGLRYAAVVHGSDLSYTVIPDLERFGPYAREACDGASGILVGSGHIQARLRQAVDDPAINAKVRLGRRASTRRCSRRSRRRTGRRGCAPPPRDQSRRQRRGNRGGCWRRDGWDRDLDRAADAVEWFAGAEAPRVIYVKLIVSKGVDLLLAAWPTVHARRARACSWSGSAPPTRAARRLERARAGASGRCGLAAHGRGLEGGRTSPVDARRSSPTFPRATPTQPAPRRARSSSRAASSTTRSPPPWRRRTLVFPSTFPEAFGMVAAEAAAAGALPVSARHRAPPRSAGLADLPDGGAAGLVRPRRRRGRPDRCPAQRLARAARGRAPPPVRPCGDLRPHLELAGRRPRCSRRRRASSTTCRSRWRIETPETSAGPGARRRRDQ